MLGEGDAFKQFAKHEMFFISVSQNDIMHILVTRNKTEVCFCSVKQAEFRRNSRIFRLLSYNSNNFCDENWRPYVEPNHTTARKPGPQ
jgi:hypothetical protein